MYEELVKRLRNLSGTDNIVEFDEAADAIEELICEVADEHNARLDAEERQRWIPVTERLPETYTWENESCLAWKDKDEPTTNGDRVRRMTDDELAGFLAEYRCVHKAPHCREANCEQCWLDWLRQEASE